jgi:hypothetical protein
MVGVIQAKDFVTESFYNGPGSFRDYRLRHLPTGMQWEVRGRAGLTTLHKMRYLFGRANSDLTGLGWETDEDWRRHMEGYAE